MIDIKIIKYFIESLEKKYSYNYRKMIYKILKINYIAKNIIKYICNHTTEFKIFVVIIF